MKDILTTTVSDEIERLAKQWDVAATLLLDLKGRQGCDWGDIDEETMREWLEEWQGTVRRCFTEKLCQGHVRPEVR